MKDADAFDLAFPASSANLGPAFDTAALALDLHLRVRARPAAAFSLRASGRDAAACADPENHLVLDVYRQTLARAGVAAPPLEIEFDNQIPIGKGCGSSAAARCAGLALAARFGQLGFGAERIFAEAARLEGHPDNAAACWWGGLVTASTPAGGEGPAICARLPMARAWPLLLAVPPHPLPTAAARAALPDYYSRSDAVANLQNAALLLAALQQGRADWLAAACHDRIHQPYRAPLCPLLPALQPLAGAHGILGVVLSGAGPAVLLFLADEAACAAAAARAALAAAHLEAELLAVAPALQGPGSDWDVIATRA